MTRAGSSWRGEGPGGTSGGGVAVASGCPAPSKLIEFDLGLLSPPEISAIGEHLSSCEPCGAILESLQERTAQDRVVDRVRRCLETPPPPLETACSGMLAALTTRTLTDVGSPDLIRLDPAGPRAGDRIGPYELGELIGRGGMGVVFRARHALLDRPVALKMILGGAYASTLAVERFLREGAAIARLDHPNIVRVYDLEEVRGLPYLAMELIEGGSLKGKLAAGPLDPREAAELLRTIALAIAYAHEAKVVHRDLTPANILLAADGTPKVADFGLAKLLDEEDASGLGPLTRTGAALGTANYMAPEQAEGDAKAVGPAADVYALGAILYAMLTGRPPYLAANSVKVLDLLRAGPPVPPSARRPGLPPPLEAICLKCLEKAPARRYATARDLADDLGRWLQGERPRETPRLPARLLASARRRTPALLAGASLIAAWGLIRSHDPGDPPPRAIRAGLAPVRPIASGGDRDRPSRGRLRAGDPKNRFVEAVDGITFLQDWDLTLYELTPDPGTDRYRFKVRVNHRKTASMGQVGLYFGLRAFPTAAADLLFFEQLTFNSVRADDDIRERFPDADIFKNRPPTPNLVRLRPRVYLEGGPGEGLDLRLPSVIGPSFDPEGEDNDRWHELEVAVTPERLTARWDGQEFSTSAADLRDRAGPILKRSKSGRKAPFPTGFQPDYDPRGGLGLYVYRGSAAFRDVSLVPLDPVPDGRASRQEVP